MEISENCISINDVSPIVDKFQNEIIVPKLYLTGLGDLTNHTMTIIDKKELSKELTDELNQELTHFADESNLNYLSDKTNAYLLEVSHHNFNHLQPLIYNLLYYALADDDYNETECYYKHFGLISRKLKESIDQYIDDHTTIKLTIPGNVISEHYDGYITFPIIYQIENKDKFKTFLYRNFNGQNINNANEDINTMFKELHNPIENLDLNNGYNVDILKAIDSNLIDNVFKLFLTYCDVGNWDEYAEYDSENYTLSMHGLKLVDTGSITFHD